MCKSLSWNCFCCNNNWKYTNCRIKRGAFNLFTRLGNAICPVYPDIICPDIIPVSILFINRFTMINLARWSRKRAISSIGILYFFRALLVIKILDLSSDYESHNCSESKYCVSYKWIYINDYFAIILKTNLLFVPVIYR